jgi:hypothetical protein
MAEFTLLKLNFEDSDFTANTPRGRRDGDDVARDDTGTSSGTGRVLAALVGLCFCVAVAYLVRTRVFGGDDEAADVDSLEDVA